MRSGAQYVPRDHGAGKCVVLDESAAAVVRGELGVNGSGYAVINFVPASERSVRLFHSSVAKDAYAPPGVEALWGTLFA